MASMYKMNTSFEKSRHGFFKPSMGQSKLIADTVKILCGTKVRIVEISGPSGTGKSFVAEKIAQDMKAQYSVAKSWPTRDAGTSVIQKLQVYQYQLSAHSSLSDMVHNISSQLAIEDGTTVRSLLRYLRQQTQNGARYLFILENVEALVFPRHEQGNNELGHVLDFCNELAFGSHDICLILTTQIKLDFVRNLESIERRTMVGFSATESAELIKAVLGPQGSLSDESVTEVFKQSAGNPRKVIEIAFQMQQLELHLDGMRRDIQIPPVHVAASGNLAEMKRDNQLTADTLMILNDIGRLHRNSLIMLVYFPGSFSPEAATAVLGAERTAFTKHDVLSPLSSTHLLSTSGTPMQRFTIQPFLRHFLEEIYMLYRSSDTKVRNRYCIFFAHLLKQMTLMEVVDRHGESFSLFNMEIDNLQKLLLEAVHCLDENYELFFDIANNAGYYILNLLPKRESVEFFEAMCSAARRHSPIQHGIMLSAFGEVLGFAQTRIAEAYQMYMKALDYLRPAGESTDLAWLYSHIGFVWHKSGKYRKAERYFNLALRMLRRQNIRLVRQERQYSVQSLPTGLRQARVALDRTQSSVLSSLGLLYNFQDKYQDSIKHHEEAIEIRKKMFGLHPSIGSAYNNLCLVYDRAGQRSKAIEYAKRGLHIKKLFVKQPSNIVLVSLLNVALFTHTYEGDTEKSLVYLDEAYEIRRSLGLRHELTGVIEVYRGDMQTHSKRWSEAAESFTRAIYWYRETEVSVQKIAEAQHKVGVALKHLGRFEEAESILQESLSITKSLVKEGQAVSKDGKNLEETTKELEDLKRIAERIEESHR